MSATSANRKYNVAVLGATGLVGGTMIELLEKMRFPVAKLYPLASKKSADEKKSVMFYKKEYRVLDAAEFDWLDADLCFSSAGAKVSAEYAPKAFEAGCVMIDNTSQFRYDEDVPLVVPEINGERVDDFYKRGVIANPNCSTIQMLMALKPIHDAVKVRRIRVSTYQSVSGSGQKGIDELNEQIEALYEGGGRKVEPKVYSKQIAYNVIPEIDALMDNKYTKEEMKMLWETRKIMEDPSIMVSATAVRVPVRRGHSEDVRIDTELPIDPEIAESLMRKMPGVKVVEMKNPGDYATALTDAEGSGDVYVSRVRKDLASDNGLVMWVVSDNIMKGAAYNAVQIGKLLIERHPSLLCEKKMWYLLDRKNRSL